MAKSWLDCVRRFGNRCFPVGNRPARPRAARLQLMLETLEDRDLLSVTPAESLASSAVGQAESYVAHQVMQYISRYESSLAAEQQTVENLGYQLFLDVSRMESATEQVLQQFYQQSLFPASSGNTSHVQSSTMVPAQPSNEQSSTPERNPISANVATSEPTGVAVPVGEVSPAGGTVPSPSDFNPSQISQAYGFNQITFKNGTIKGDGSGQTIAIVGAYDQPSIVSDLQSFDNYYNIAAPPSLTVVNQNGVSSLPSGDVHWGTEESLDVEWAHAMAPGANIVLVEANSDSWSDLSTAINYARNISGVSVVSMSFTWGDVQGDGEFSTESGYDSYFTTPSGHTNVTFVAATGDKGTGAYEPAYPSTSPNILAVGGTELTTDSAGNYQSEQGWSGSGGGISAYEAQPSYQNKVVAQNSTQRAVPDVALNAVNYIYYDSYGESGWLNGWTGTSFATPIWASLIAIADQGRALNGEGTLDGPTQTLPALYQMPSSNFHDITSGNNGLYQAGPSYDLVTGLGTPIANKVVSSLVSYGAPSSSWTQQDLSSDYNLDGLTWGGRTISDSGIDGKSDALEGYTQFSWQGTVIHPGTPGTLDVVSAQGQTINLSATGQYSTLTLFATAIGKQANQPFAVNYSSGPSQTFTRSFTDWLSAPGLPGGSSDELKVMQTYAFNPDGSKKGTAYFSAYALPLDPSRTVTSITLPNDPNIVILAMELT